MLRLYQLVLSAIEQAFPEIAGAVPAPVMTVRNSLTVFRYEDQTVEQALVLKLARTNSGLNAAIILLISGYIQELRAHYRMLDEFGEDVVFLGDVIVTGEVTPLQERYLIDFWAEEFDVDGNPLQSSQKRDRIGRDKIQAAIARQEVSPVNPSDGQAVHRTLVKTNSGYIHGASPHIMELYGGEPGRFHLTGMAGTPVMNFALKEAGNYIYRGLLMNNHVAMLLGCETAERELRRVKGLYEAETGAGQGDAQEMIKAQKK